MTITFIIDYIEKKCMNKKKTKWDFPKDIETLQEIIEDIHNLLVKVEKFTPTNGDKPE